tara:strand:- start:201 stop:827 length:627 start_codon:yes stop_codon:yes gene_type:complete
MRKIIIFGTSGHAKVVAEAIIKMNKFDLLGFIDNKKSNTNKDVYKGYKILGDDDVIISLFKVFPDLLAHIGVGDNKIRKKIFKKFSYLQFPTIIHPSSTISNDVTIDDGSFVGSSVSIINGSQIGKHVILNTASSIDHDTKILDFSFISPNTSIAGNVKIEENVFVGTGVKIIPNVTIKNGSIIGAGATVIKNVEANLTVIGTPAKKK